MTRVRHSERIKTADDVLNYDFANNILVVFLVQTAADDDDDDDGGGNNQSLVQGATAEIWNVLTGEKVGYMHILSCIWSVRSDGCRP